MKEVLEALANGRSEHIDPRMAREIESWKGNPTALQLLHALDMGARYALASDFVLKTLDAIWLIKLREEGATPEQVIAQAEWREKKC